MTASSVTVDYIRGIPVFCFANNSRMACDEYIKLFGEELQKNYYAVENPNSHYPSVMDLSQSGMFSIKYMADKLKQAHIALENPPQMITAYIIQNVQDETLFGLVNNMKISAVSLTRKIFHEGEMDEAINWLLSYDPAL